MRILIINQFYYPNMAGGTEHSIKLLAESLSKNGDTVAVYSLDAPCKNAIKEIEEINGVKIYRGYSRNIYVKRILNKGTWLDKLANGYHSIHNGNSNRQLKYAVKDFNPDIIHTNNPVSISYWIWKYAKRNNIRVVHTLRDYWLLDPRTVIHKNSFLIRIYRWYFRNLTNRYVESVTAPSKATLDIFIKEGYFKNAKKTVIVNAVDVNMQIYFKNLKEKNTRKDKTIRFLYVGGLSENKGIKNLLNTIENLGSEYSLTICGDGKLREYVMKCCDSNDRIVYRGKLDFSLLCHEYEKADVLVVPSVWEEPFGRIVIEGAQYACAVLGSNRGGIRETIEVLNCGKVFCVEKADEFLKVLQEFSNRKTINFYASNIKENMERYSLQNHTLEYVDLYGGK